MKEPRKVPKRASRKTKDPEMPAHEILVAWAQIISEAARDPEMAALMETDLEAAFQAFGVKLPKSFDADKDLVPSMEQAQHIVAAGLAEAPKAGSGFSPGHIEQAAQSQQQSQPCVGAAGASGGSFTMGHGPSAMGPEPVAGDCWGTVFCIGTAGSVSGCAGTFGTVGTAGTGGDLTAEPGTPPLSQRPVQSMRLSGGAMGATGATMGSNPLSGACSASIGTAACVGSVGGCIGCAGTVGSWGCAGNLSAEPSAPQTQQFATAAIRTQPMQGDPLAGGSCWGSAGTFGTAGTAGGTVATIGTAATYGCGSELTAEPGQPNISTMRPRQQFAMQSGAGTAASGAGTTAPSAGTVSGGTFGSVATAACLGTAGGCVGTFGTAGSVGTAGLTAEQPGQTFSPSAIRSSQLSGATAASFATFCGCVNTPNPSMPGGTAGPAQNATAAPNSGLGGCASTCVPLPTVATITCVSTSACPGACFNPGANPRQTFSQR